MRFSVQSVGRAATRRRSTSFTNSTFGRRRSDHVSAIERGATFPNLIPVLRLAAALDCRVNEIVSVFDDSDLSKILQK
jgi:hypothetical protein